MGVSFYLVYSHFAAYGPDRGFIFGLIPLSMLLALVMNSIFPNNPNLGPYLQGNKLYGRKPRTILTKVYHMILPILIVLFISVSILILPVTRYGGDPYAFVSDSVLSARLFFINHPEADEGQILVPYRYNLWELKQQKGQEYLNSFNSVNLNRAYDSGPSQMYIIVRE